MRIANTLTVISALLCAAGCGAKEPTEEAEHSHGSEPHAASGTAGSAAGQGAKAAGGTAAPANANTPKTGTTANASQMTAAAAAGAASKPQDMAATMASAGSASAAGASAAAAGGGAAGSPAMAAAGAGATPVATEKFSFFITSLQGMRDLSKSDDGFGGDLRYGEETGLKGADKICTELAERSMPGAGGKGWRAFLSAAKGGDGGTPVHAKDRIGAGPWYDRLGRLVAKNVTDLLNERPVGADPAIKDDLPNERGEPNHTDTTPEAEDNHDVVTGTNPQGMWDGKMTCEDWTSTETPPPPMKTPEEMMMMGPWGNIAMEGPGLGHSWPSDFSGTSWVTAHRAPGCSPSVSLVQMGGGMGTGIGNSGGYGGIYCFALMP